MPIATAMLPVASQIIHPMPDPAAALNRAVIASARSDGLSISFCSMLYVPSMCLYRRTLKLSDPTELCGSGAAPDSALLQHPVQPQRILDQWPRPIRARVNPVVG